MRVTFIWPSSAQYTGGVVVLYRMADELARRGATVRFVHGPKTEWRVDDPSEITWHDFHPAIEHFVVDDLEAADLPDGDIVMVPGAPDHLGLPVSVVQGHRMVRADWERQAYRFRGLKIVVARWLAEQGLRYGVPPEQMVLMPHGIDHHLFRQVVPYEDRPIDVAVLYNRHPSKGWKVAEQALTRVRAQRPDLTVQAFAVVEPTHALPSWIDFRIATDRRVLAEEIFNRSKIILQASHHEGFGLTAAEAMASGAALVTTDNGGSSEYARDGLTAIVRPPGDAVGLADGVLEVLEDDDLRVRLADAGSALIRERFTWDRACEVMYTALATYLDHPEHFRRPLGLDTYEDPDGPEGWNQEVLEVESFAPRSDGVGDAASAEVPSDTSRPAAGRGAAERPREEDLVWNVVWTGTVFDRLRYFVASQMAHTTGRFRFVANGCPPEEVAKMEAFRAAHPEKVVEVFTAYEDMKAHGQALDRVLDERDDGLLFCFIDPDIKATGPFAGELLDLLDGHGAVTSGKEIWNRDSTLPEGHPGVAGEFFFGPDGFVYGSPHLAIYDRAALAASTERWGVSLGSAGPDVSEEAVEAMAAVGQRFLVYDTAKVVNILLTADGHPIAHRDLTQLLHIGGLSHYISPSGYVTLADGRREPEWARWDRVSPRLEVARYTAHLLSAEIDGTERPPLPTIDDDHLGRVLPVVRDAVEDMVARYRSAMPEATRP